MDTTILDLTCELIRRASVTPEDAGCQALLGERLARAGFAVESMPFGKVNNLWASHGQGSPVFVFLGHTDVVPSGPVSAWTSDPFTPTVRDGRLYGRGAADMKAGVAAMTLALEAFVKAQPQHQGTVALLLTSDEEGDAQDGVKRVIEEFGQRGQKIDFCVIGEPSSRERLGDIIRVGRRGSLNGRLHVHGVQGHAAYPEKALNPIHAAAPAIADLVQMVWDCGNDAFPPTSFQISNIHAGTGAYNVIPGELEILLNFRYGTANCAEDLRMRVEAVLRSKGLNFDIDWQLSGLPFLTKAGRLRDAVTHAIQTELGIQTQADTGGGTSDGRFVAPFGAEVVEVGPVNSSIHKIDEWMDLADLERMPNLYLAMLNRLWLSADRLA